MGELESDENYNYFQQCNEFASYSDKHGSQFKDTLRDDEGVLEDYNSVDDLLTSPFSRECESFFDQSTPTPMMAAPCRKTRPCYKVFKQVTPPSQSPWVRKLGKIPNLTAGTPLFKSEDFSSSERPRGNESQLGRNSNFSKTPFVKEARLTNRNFDVHIDEENMNVRQPFQESTRTNSRALDQSDLNSVDKRRRDDGQSLKNGNLWRSRMYSGGPSEEGLLPVCIMGPIWSRFFKFSHFNSMQTEAFPEIFNSDSNCVIASPFGSGKSVLQELAFARMISNKKKGRALYLAVNQTTCLQKLNKWHHKFGKIKKRIGLLGENRYEAQVDIMLNSDIVISTAESWDNLIRIWRENQHLAGLVDLLIIDELNLISEPGGAVLEAVITRLHYMCKSIRIVATCLPFPNISDICCWLKSKDGAKEACAFVFDDSYVPKRVEKKLLGFDNSKEGDFHYDSVLNSQLLTIIRANKLSSGVIIFCPSNKSCVSTAEYLALHNKSLGIDGSNSVVSDFTNNSDLNYLVRQGVGFCYKGLKSVDLRKLFDLFSSGGISILCCTVSILQEENFTAPNAIIKGVKRFIKGRLSEYNRTDIWRMMSTVYRNFRKSYGKVIVVTDLENLPFYRDLLSNELPVESSLDARILEYILSEISLRKVCSTKDIMSWLKGTFLYCSRKVNNTLESSGFQKIASSYNMQLESYCSNTLKVLQESGLIVSRNYSSLRITNFGSIMYRYGLSYSTMKRLMACKAGNSIFELLCVLSELDVFSEIEVGALEHKLLREMNSSFLLEFPLNVCEFKKSDKINLLFQLLLFGTEEKIKNNHLRIDELYLEDIRSIQKWGPKITSCMAEIFAYKKDTYSLQNALTLKQSIYAKLNKDVTPFSALVETSKNQYFDSPLYDIFDNSIHSHSERVNFPSLFLSEQIKNCDLLDQLPAINFNANMTSSEVNLETKAIDVRFKVSIRLARIKGSPRKIKNIVFDSFAERSDHTLVDFRKVPISVLTTTNDFSFHLSAQVFDKNQNICCYLLPQNIENVSYRCLLNLHEIEDWKFHRVAYLNSKNSRSKQSESLTSFLANDKTKVSTESVSPFEVSNADKQKVGSDEMCSNSVDYAFEPYIHASVDSVEPKFVKDGSYKSRSDRNFGNQNEKVLSRRSVFGKKKSINKPKKLQYIFRTENKLKTSLKRGSLIKPSFNEYQCEKKDDDIVPKDNYKSDFSFSNSEIETPFKEQNLSPTNLTKNLNV